MVSRGTERRFAEGSNLYKKDGWYYLLLAEGGTGYAHCVTMGRSRFVIGPYEACPHGPVLTSAPGEFSAFESNPFMMPERYNPQTSLQKSGHGSLVETQNGEWYMAHLCGRPIMPELRCVLGRETSIQMMEWTDDGWLQVAGGGNLAQGDVPAPDLPEHRFPLESSRYDFAASVLSADFCTAHGEITPDWVNCGNGLSLRGRETLTSNFAASLIARRLTAFHAEVTAHLRYSPENYHHMAGITAYYDSASHYCACKTWDENRGAVLAVYGFERGQMTVFEICTEVPVDAPVWLRARIEDAQLRFLYSTDGKGYQTLGPVLDMLSLSDEAGSTGIFTGAFVGMFSQDTHTKQKWAEFGYFDYRTPD